MLPTPVGLQSFRPSTPTKSFVKVPERQPGASPRDICLRGIAGGMGCGEHQGVCHSNRLHAKFDYELPRNRVNASDYENA